MEFLAISLYILERGRKVLYDVLYFTTYSTKKINKLFYAVGKCNVLWADIPSLLEVIP